MSVVDVVALVAVGVFFVCVVAYAYGLAEGLWLEHRRRRDLAAGVCGEGERLRRLGECTKRNG